MEEKKLTDEEIVKALENEIEGKIWLSKGNIAPIKNAIDLIRRLQSENTEQKAEIERLTELKTVKTVDRNGLCVTFFHKTKEVGVASVCDYQGREDNFLHGVEVKEQYRGQGYGRKIVGYMTTHYPIDTLYVEKANNSAIRLYERFGFALTCDTFDKDGKTMAVMARGNELYKQAVKDTAKEIWEKANNKSYFRNCGVLLDYRDLVIDMQSLKEIIKGKGVEVE